MALHPDFPDECSDVVSFAKNYLAVHFKLDYVNADGDISNVLHRHYDES